MWPEHEVMSKALKFDLEAKGQHRMGIRNAHDLLSQGDTLMCQYDMTMSKQKTLRVRICTDRRTERLILLYPQIFDKGGGGGNNTQNIYVLM